MSLGSRLIVGTAESGLLVYDVKKDSEGKFENFYFPIYWCILVYIVIWWNDLFGNIEGYNITVLEAHKGFSKGKPVNQINVVDSHRILISLSGNWESFLNIFILILILYYWRW